MGGVLPTVETWLMEKQTIMLGEPFQTWIRHIQGRFTAALSRREIEILVDGIQEAEIEQLSEYYALALSDSNLATLSAWLADPARPVPMADDERCIRTMINIFGELGRRGYRPFSDQEFSSLPEAMPDPAKLPDDLRPLFGASLIAARLADESADHDGVLQETSLTPSDIETLKAAAEHILRIGYARVRVWCREMGVREHSEAGMLYTLVGVLDALGLPYY